MPNIRVLAVWHTDVVEIHYIRKGDQGPEMIVTRQSAPASGTWVPAPENQLQITSPVPATGREEDA